jgi:hypothetical protein
MDLPVETVIGGFVAMGTAIAVLFGLHARNAAHCQKETGRLWKKVDDLDKYHREELTRLITTTTNIAATATPLLDRALRVIKRHEAKHPINDDTPLASHASHTSPCG